MSVLIIAEAGVNHNGDMALARQLIDEAARAGADMVKFQTFSAERVVTVSAQKAKYQEYAIHSAETQFEMLRRLELTEEMHEDLLEHCKSRGIKFFSTAFDTESIDMLLALGIDCIKVPSGEITNLPYLRHVGRTGRPVILSTGMSELIEVSDAINVLVQEGLDKTSITALHCSTEYPTPMVDVNLRAMLSMREALGVEVGYSDHTVGIEVATAAVAMGATIIEKHFTISRKLPGPDHKASLEPDELRALVQSIRNIEVAMGDGLKRPCHGELNNISVARRSIVAATHIRRGDIFTETNLTTKRPGTGISPMLWDDWVGRTASRDYKPDELIRP